MTGQMLAGSEVGQLHGKGGGKVRNQLLIVLPQLSWLREGSLWLYQTPTGPQRMVWSPKAFCYFHVALMSLTSFHQNKHLCGSRSQVVSCS